MKAKLYLVLFCAMFFAHNSLLRSQAQPEKQNIQDGVIIRVIYSATEQALKEGAPVAITDTMALNIGKEWSVYYDWNKNRRDSIAEFEFEFEKFKGLSLMGSDDQGELQARLDAKEKALSVLDESIGESMQIFKHRKNNDVITFDDGPLEDFDNFTNFKLTEKIPFTDWEITNDTLTVLGYRCKRAATTFRGRTYSAWFTPDIPIDDGPWKLYGLPGLILKVDRVNARNFLSLLSL